MSSGCRTIGLVLLLFACGGDLARDHSTETASDPKVLRINILGNVGSMSGSPASGVSRSSTSIEGGCAVLNGWPSPGVGVSCGALLRLGCLLSV